MVVECDKLVYTAINALTFKITGNTSCLSPKYEKASIVSLKGPEGLDICLGLTVPIRKNLYKVNIIERVSDEMMSISNKVEYHVSIAKRTKSSTFLMPMMPGSRNLYFWDKLFVNCFIGTEEDEDCIAILYRFSSNLTYIKFEQVLTSLKTFRRKYDPEPHYVMFILDIPKGYSKDYRAFRLGKYSELSREYKIDVLDFHDAEIEDEIGQILFKSPARKKLLEEKLGADLPEGSELLSILDEEKETYNPDIYKLKKLL